jgi:endonuclease-3
MTPEKIHEIFRRFQAANPHPTTELVYATPYELLVAVILSAQATDVSVNKATGPLFEKANTPQSMVELGVSNLLPYVSKINLYRNKAKYVVDMSRLLLERHGGEVPSTRKELEALPGVGGKTASVLLNTAFGQPVIAVDTHIFRVSNRTGIAFGKSPDHVARALTDVVPDEFKRNAHHWLLLHGRYICTARLPKCRDCLINDLCEYPDKTAAGLKDDETSGGQG